MKIDEVDVARLVSQIEAQPELWNQYNYRKGLDPHLEMSDIWVRYNDIKNLGPHFNDEHEAVWYPAYRALPHLKQLIFPLLAKVEGTRLGGVLITKIPPGCEIKPHIDRGWHVDYYDKFYISLKSQTGANFYSGDEVLCPKTGEVWRFDNRLSHWVKNDSAEDRVTLIVCIRTEKYQEH